MNLIRLGPASARVIGGVSPGQSVTRLTDQLFVAGSWEEHLAQHPTTPRNHRGRSTITAGTRYPDLGNIRHLTSRS